MSDEGLLRHREVWLRKPILRLLYTQWYQEMSSYLKPGRTLEVGGGTGNLKEFAPHVICTDLIQVPWLDVVADAQHLPFASGSLANIVLFDSLHHVENVRLFFDEAMRALQPSGCIVIMDPYISWLSWPIYYFIHPEPVDLSHDPLAIQAPDVQRKPFDSNQAVATTLFERSFEKFSQQYPRLIKIHHRRLAFFVYPLSGGFDHTSLLPLAFVRSLLAIERALDGLSRLLAFRILVVLEKKG